MSVVQSRRSCRIARSLALADVHELVDKSEFYYIGLPPSELQRLGQTLYRWLEGDDRRLSAELNRLAGGPAIVTLAIVAGDTELDRLPWELLHDGQHWCHERGSLALVPVRCCKPPLPPLPPHDPRRPPKQASDEPANRPLEVVFMAASPEIGHNATPHGNRPLDYEAEEARILQAAAPHGSVQVYVEESGNIDELGRLWQALAEHPPNIVHLTGHAGHDQDDPIFVMEKLEGGPDHVSPTRLNRALGGNRPRLSKSKGSGLFHRWRDGIICGRSTTRRTNRPKPLRADEAGGQYHVLKRGNLDVTIFHKYAEFEAFQTNWHKGL
jgi:hypothetical protein